MTGNFANKEFTADFVDDLVKFEPHNDIGYLNREIENSIDHLNHEIEKSLDKFRDSFWEVMCSFEED